MAKLSKECNLVFCCEHLFILQLPFPLLQAIVPHLETGGNSLLPHFRSWGVSEFPSISGDTHIRQSTRQIPLSTVVKIV